MARLVEALKSLSMQFGQRKHLRERIFLSIFEEKIGISRTNHREESMHPPSWKSSSEFITIEDICRSYLCIDIEQLNPLPFSKKNWNSWVLSFFGTRSTRLMPDSTGPRALSVPGEHRSELLRTLTRENYIYGGSSNFGKHITRHYNA